MLTVGLGAASVMLPPRRQRKHQPQARASAVGWKTQPVLWGYSDPQPDRTYARYSQLRLTDSDRFCVNAEQYVSANLLVKQPSNGLSYLTLVQNSANRSLQLRRMASSRVRRSTALRGRVRPLCPPSGTELRHSSKTRSGRLIPILYKRLMPLRPVTQSVVAACAAVW